VLSKREGKGGEQCFIHYLLSLKRVSFLSPNAHGNQRNHKLLFEDLFSKHSFTRKNNYIGQTFCCRFSNLNDSSGDSLSFYPRKAV
jgi:hypothetical protein